MKTRLVLGLVFGLLSSFIALNSAHASAMLDSTSGGDYYFTWSGGMGPIDTIFKLPDTSSNLGNDWSITVSKNSYLTIVTAWDGFVPGDAFKLRVDGVLIDWTAITVDTNGYFHGTYNNLYLSAGTHTITLDVVGLAPGFTGGGAYASFSGTSPAPVPIPATMLLFGTGIGGLAVSRLRRKINL